MNSPGSCLERTRPAKSARARRVTKASRSDGDNCSSLRTNSSRLIRGFGIRRPNCLGGEMGLLPSV